MESLPPSPDADLQAWVPHLVSVARTLTAAGPRAGGLGPRLEPREVSQLSQAVQRLSLGLTRDRALVGERYLDQPWLLAAYLLFYWPVSYAQVRRLLTELPPLQGPVLDLGSGPGPATFAALDAGAHRVLAADRSKPALALIERLAERTGRKGVSTRSWSSNLETPAGQFSLIVAQHLLNELWLDGESLEQRVALCRRLLGQLRPGGTLLLIEPALRETSRELLQLRNRLVREGFAVRAPCLYRGDCQALDRPSDWCHAERQWEAPSIVSQLGKAAGIRKERLKMSYLALAPAGESWPELPPGRLLRIVSEPLQGKGRRRYMGCGPEGRLGLALQDKHLAPPNAAFAQLDRGEVIRIEGAEPKGDGIGLGADSQVTRVSAPGEAIPRGTNSGAG